MEIYTIPVLEDNYAYLLVDAKTRDAAAVDPVDARKVTEVAKSKNAKIQSVFTTHHHWDHANGNPEMLELHPGITVYGGDDRVPALSKKVGQKDAIKVGSINVTVFASPCHTSGHVLYLASSEGGDEAIFTGDTLFIGGCGRFFEGTAAQMFQNLRTISELKPSTKIFVGHEYTVKNMKFALTIEPNNADYKAALAKAEEQRQRNEPTVPSTVENEINIFMRCKEPAVAAAVGLAGLDPISVLGELRARKDKY